MADGAETDRPRVTIFAPSPTLTVTVEDHPSGDEVHVHAGGQGVWQARMLLQLGIEVVMCCVLTGETGRILRRLLEDEGIEVVGIERDGRGSAYVHDRRGGERVAVVEVDGDPLGRHELDELYGRVLGEGLASALVILSGPAGDESLPADTYRRLAADLTTAGARVVVDLAGERLEAAVEGGVSVVKVSDEELERDGIADRASSDGIHDAMRRLRERGVDAVVVTRAGDPLWLLDGDGFVEITPPHLEVHDHRGAGDSLTAGLVAGLARGEAVRAAVALGAAAGALNVTRHGLGTGERETIDRLREAVVTVELDDEAAGGGDQPVTGRVSPDGLATLAAPTEAGTADEAGAESAS